MDTNKHKYFLLQILKDIYSDSELAVNLGFKGGTALMFFYDLPRFSVDLDFDLIDKSKEKVIYEKIRKIVLRYGKIHDEAIKFYGLIIVLDYGAGERKLKIEISSRTFDNQYEIRNLLGIDVKVMVAPDMFAHKLCALLDRTEMTNRDIFDCWFFLQRKTPINRKIVEERMQMSLNQHIQLCIESLENKSDRGILNGLGELTDPEIKNFVKNNLRKETISLLNFFKEFPIEKIVVSS